MGYFYVVLLVVKTESIPLSSKGPRMPSSVFLQTVSCGSSSVDAVTADEYQPSGLLYWLVYYSLYTTSLDVLLLDTTHCSL
jgi:hypothetical protein